MKIVYKLTGDDIREIIAEKYGASKEDVTLYIHESTTNFGMTNKSYVTGEVEVKS